MKDEKGVKQLWEQMKKQKEEQDKAQQKIPEDKEQIKGKDKETDDKEIQDDEKREEEKEREAQVDKLLENINIFAQLKRDKEARQEQMEYDKMISIFDLSLTNHCFQIRKRMGAKNEVHFLEKSAVKGREQLVAFWEKRSADFDQVYLAI